MEILKTENGSTFELTQANLSEVPNEGQCAEFLVFPEMCGIRLHGYKASVPRIVGIDQLIYLIRKQSERVSLEDLVRARNDIGEEEKAQIISRNLKQGVVDHRALKEIRMQIILIAQQLTTPDLDADTRDDLIDQKLKYEKYLTDGTYGRTIKGFSDGCRLQVRGAIAYAIKKIKKSNVYIGSHFEDSVDYGWTPRYRPTGSMKWKISYKQHWL